MSTKEIVDALVRLFEILISWPVVGLLVVIAVRKELPKLISDLSERMTKAPGGFEFAALQQKVETLNTKVERLEQVTFESSTALTPEIQNQVQSSLDAFQEYVSELGYKSKTGVRLFVSPDEKNNVSYDGDRMIVGVSMTKDTDAIYRSYTHHILCGNMDFNSFTNKQQAVESGLADYFPCSYNNDPLFGEKSVHLFQEEYPELRNKPAIRNLNNNRRFDDASNDLEYHDKGEIWGGAFWDLRQQLGQGTVDKLLYSSWTALQSSAIRTDFDAKFARKLLETAQSLGGGEHTNDIQAIFKRRGLKL